MTQEGLPVGEFSYGRYQVQLVEWADGEWQGRGYWLRALVTNRRLLVYPDLGGLLRPNEDIDSSEIARVWNVSLGGRDGIMVLLKEGRALHLLVDWSQGGKLARDIRELIAPMQRPRILPRLKAH